MNTNELSGLQKNARVQGESVLRVNKDQMILESTRIFAARKQGVPIEVQVDQWLKFDDVLVRAIWRSDRILFRIDSLSRLRRFLSLAPQSCLPRIYFWIDERNASHFRHMTRFCYALKFYERFPELPKIIARKPEGPHSLDFSFLPANHLREQFAKTSPKFFKISLLASGFRISSNPKRQTPSTRHFLMGHFIQWKDSLLGRIKYLALRYGLKPIYFLNYQRRKWQKRVNGAINA